MDCTHFIFFHFYFFFLKSISLSLCLALRVCVVCGERVGRLLPPLGQRRRGRRRRRGRGDGEPAAHEQVLSRCFVVCVCVFLCGCMWFIGCGCMERVKKGGREDGSTLDLLLITHIITIMALGGKGKETNTHTMHRIEEGVYFVCGLGRRWMCVWFIRLFVFV